MRDVLEAILTHPSGDAGDARRDPALHEAVLGQHGPVQQPHRAKVRPELHARAVCGGGARGGGARARQFPLRQGESLDALLERLKPMFFDASVDPSVTTKTPADGRDILQSSANNLYAGVTMKDLEAFDERYPLNSRLVKKNGKIVEEVYRVGGLYDPQIRDVIGHLDARHPVRDGADGQGAARAHSVVPHRRRARPPRVRHRVGRRQVVAGRHDQRLHRGLSRRARHQRRVGSARLLREHDQDRRDPEARRRSAVVREPHAVGPAVLQGKRARVSPRTSSTSSSRPAMPGR